MKTSPPVPKLALRDVRKPKQCNRCPCEDSRCNSGALPIPFQVHSSSSKEKQMEGTIHQDDSLQGKVGPR